MDDAPKNGWDQLRAVNQVGKKVGACLAPDRAAQKAVELIQALVNPDLTFIFKLDRKGLKLVESACSQNGPAPAIEPIHQVGQCLCGLAASGEKPIYSSNIHNDERCTWRECKRAGMCSFAAIPLKSRGNLLGVLGLASKKPRFFQSSSNFLETIAGQVALALDNAGLIQAAQRQADESQRRYEQLQSAQKKLANNESRFRTMMDFTHDWDYWIGPQGGIEYSSPSSMRITGYSPAEFQNNPELITQIIHPADRHIYTGHMEGANPPVEGLEYRIIAKDGREVWIGHACRPVFNSDGIWIGRRVSNRDITSRKKIENKFRVQSERLDLALDATNDGLWDWDIAKDTLFFSPRNYTMLGYQPDEFEASFDSWTSLLHPDDSGPVLATLHEHMEKGSAHFELEFRLRKKDGGWLWVLGRGKVMERGRDGKPLRMLGTQTDISQRKKGEQILKKDRDELEQKVTERTAELSAANQRLKSEIQERARTEEALKKSDSFNRSIINSSRDCIKVLDAQGRLKFMSLGGQKQLGIKDFSDYQDMAYESFWQGTDLTNARAALRRTLEGTDSFFTGFSPTADGVPRWWDVVLSPIRDESGRVTSILAVSRDVTSRRAMEKALAESITKHRTLIKNMRDGFVSLDMRGVIQEYNKSFLDMLGYDSEEVKGLNIRGLTPENWRDAEEKIISEQVIRRGYSDIYQKELIRKDGSLLPVSLRAHLIRGDHGEPVEMWAIIRDVTEQNRVRRQLVKAKELAESADRAKSLFLANMGHEIRTPMNAIMGMTSLALETKLDAEQRDYLEIVKSSADHLLNLINDILDLSKNQSGQARLDELEFSIRPALGDLLKPLVDQAAAKGLKMVLKVHDRVPEVLLGDLSRLRQALFKLIDNSIKFTDSGEVLVEVSPGQKPDWLRFAVTDAGIGIAPQKHKEIFEPFVQADPSFTRRYGGSGLGLAIAGRLAAIMGGAISVSSSPGQGSAFYLDVPMRCASCETTAEAKPQSALKAEARGGGLKILLVENNRVNRKVAKALLVKRGHKVHVVDTAGQAAEALAGDQFDLILVDLDIPLKGGSQPGNLALGRAMDETGRPPIWAMGGRDDAAQKHILASDAFSGRLKKPIDPDELDKALLQAASHKKADKPAKK